MKLALFLGAVAILVGSIDVGEARTLAPAEKAMIREVVTKGFKDPDAAKFKWLPLVDRNKWLPDADQPGRWKLLSCGLVNGKNSYGAYTGYTTFAVGLTIEKDRIIAAQLLGIAQREQQDADYWHLLCNANQNTAQAR